MPERQAPAMTREERLEYLRLLETDPEQFLRMAEETVRNYPEDPLGYEDCAAYYTEIELYDDALRFLDKALAIEPDKTSTRFERGTVLMQAERYREALDTFDACEPAKREFFRDGIVACRATCHAYLGNLEAGLAECAKLPDQYNMPCLYGEFDGTKAQIIEAVRSVATTTRNAAGWLENIRSTGKIADDED